MIHLGYMPVNGAAYLPFSTNDANGAAITFTGTVSNFKVYKNGSVTERTSTAGITLSKDFDGATGSHLITLDLTDNTDAGFWADGAVYTIAANGITVDAKTVTAWVGAFRIGTAAANTTQVNGTAQTARDLGLSVLLSSGTGTGQLDFTAGVVKANLAQILGSVITGTAALLVAAFTKFFNVAAPTATCLSLPDAVPGANGGLPTTNGTKNNQTVDLTAGQSIAASSVPAVTLANGAHGGAVATITLQAPIAATVPDSQKVDVHTIKTEAVTCAAPVTVLASVGTAAVSTAQTGDVETLITTVGVAGAGLTALGDTRLANLDATVGSRSTYAGGAVASVTGSVGSVASFGTLVADIATAIWAAGARTLTAFGFSVTASSVADKTGYSLTTAPPTASDVATAVWGAGTRTLSSFGTLVADVATAVWGAGTRVLTAFEFTVAATPDANVALIKAKTDLIPAVPAAVGSAMTLDAAYDPAKSAAPTGAAMTLTGAYDAAKTAAPTVAQIFAALMGADTSAITTLADESLLTALRLLGGMKNWSVKMEAGHVNLYAPGSGTPAVSRAITTDVGALPITEVTA
jgi:hypothetical protein